MEPKLLGAAFAFLAGLSSIHVSAQDCPSTTETVTYYGNTTESCTAIFSNYGSANGRCVDNPMEYTVRQFVEETTESEKRISERKIVENNKCSNGQVTPLGKVWQQLSCDARLTVSRREEVSTGKACDAIDYLDASGEILPLYPAEQIGESSSRKTVLTSREETREILTWMSDHGNTRIEYLDRTANPWVWKHLGLFGPDTSYTYVDYKDMFRVGTRFHEFEWWNCRPPSRIPVGRSPDLVTAFRIRSESFDRNSAGPWSYSALQNIFYGSDQRCVIQGWQQPDGSWF